uniref:Uncharacterized protein n=1 Tax=Amphimedon queenslandica TaxID=400682 RepID=A0A1X7STP3_AMPQE
MNGDRWYKALLSDMDDAVTVMVASPPDNVEAGINNHAINVPNLPRTNDDEDVAVVVSNAKRQNLYILAQNQKCAGKAFAH